MGQTYALSATVREKVGKGAARSVRRQGQIPAVIYGGSTPPVSINLDAREITNRIYGGGFYTTLATIDVGGDKIQVIPRDFQIDPMTERPLHVDFLRVQSGGKITVDVPVQFINESQAPGIRRGGALNVVRHRVELVVPVDAIPEKLVADLTGLEINDSLHISQVALPEGVSPVIKRNFTIATVTAPAGVKEELRAAAEAAKAAAEAAAAAAEAGAEGAAPAEGGGAPAAPAAGGDAKAAAPADAKGGGKK